MPHAARADFFTAKGAYPRLRSDALDWLVSGAARLAGAALRPVWWKLQPGCGAAAARLKFL